MDSRIRIKQILKYFFEENINLKIKPFGSGLIHRTFFLENDQGKFILQKINHSIFPNPDLVMKNIDLISRFLKKIGYPKTVLEIYKTLDGQLCFKEQDGSFWRIFYFIDESQTFATTKSENHVFEVGKSFGEFIFYLKDFPREQISPTIQNFHNLDFRYDHLQKTLADNRLGRAQFAKEEIQKIDQFKFLKEKINQIEFPNRIVHADPKINNLIFDKNEVVKAVIDWDTIMVGKVIFDFGDLVRTTCCNQNEDAINISELRIIPHYLTKLKDGFLSSTQSFLLDVEKENLLLGAKAIIWEQSVRFLTDFLDGDEYYLTTYSNQNLIRTKNQLALLESLIH